MQVVFKRNKCLLIALLSSLSVGVIAYGSGFALREQSAEGIGKAYAGGPAGFSDNSSAFYNPAAMPFAAGGATFGAHLIHINSEFTDKGSFNAVSRAPLGGGNGGNAGGVALVPNLYYVGAINEEMNYGIAINSPFGLATEWDDGWVGRYHALKSELKTININPSVSYKVNDKLSVGAGVSAMYAEAELSNAINLSAIAGTRVPDARAKVEGDDWAYGYNAGVAYSWSEDARVGLHYRSKVEVDVDGDATFSVAPPLVPLFAARGLFQDSDASASVELPETVSFGYVNGISEKITVAFSADWTRWSRFDELRVDFASAQPDSVTEENWDDTIAVALGMDYALKDNLTLRGGLMYDESPVPSAGFRTPRIPDADRYWVTAGVSFNASEDVRIDVGYAHLFTPDEDIRHANSTGDVLVGEVEGDVDILSAQLTMDL